MQHFTFPDTPIPKAYGPYSHAVVAGDLVFISGQTGRDSQTGRVIDGDISVQTQRTIEIINEILNKLNLSLSNIVKTTVYLKNIEDYSAMNIVYSAMLKQNYPARVIVQTDLPLGALIGMEAIAYKKGIEDSHNLNK